MELQISVTAPQRDAEGNLINLFTPKPRMSLTLPSAESGLLHIPVTPQLPTRPGNGYTVLVHPAVSVPERFAQIRSLDGGPPPSMLGISPFRMAVLSDIAFGADTQASNKLRVSFDVLPGRLPPRSEEPLPRYEALWTVRDLQQEQAKARAMASEALRFANSLTRTNVYQPLWDRTKNSFGDAGIPLHPGEVTFITKLLVYVMEDGLELESEFSLAEGKWFDRLCWLMAHNPDIIHDIPQLVKILYTAVVHDAVQLGFHMISHASKADFGADEEQRVYAERVVGALEGQVPLALEHIYLPLVMGGTLVTAQVTTSDENPWTSLGQLKEAQQGRISLAGAEQSAFREVFDILDVLIEKAQRNLWEMRIPRE
jgi:hypothetical protein